ncbi:histone-like nucleoid-structuring protein Lsr2 [Amycolatopsis sp. NPDC047767]|uniref:histone-like nucleoid-structuring protein Lsr2 n=1 Tax=Amycolatopsis sp. NPDC047767 TaxID=3156765 RepID=UPI0034532492
MAKNTAVHVLDDLTGEPAAETVGFGLDGLDYEIDLSAPNAAALREIFDPYVANGRRTGGRKQRPRLVAGAKAVAPQEVPAKPQPAKPAKRTAAAAKTTARPATQAEPAPKTAQAKKPVKNAAAEPKTVVKTTEPKPARRPVKKIPAVTFSAGE